jgi:hypothetical protein
MKIRQVEAELINVDERTDEFTDSGFSQFRERT